MRLVHRGFHCDKRWLPLSCFVVCCRCIFDYFGFNFGKVNFRIDFLSSGQSYLDVCSGLFRCRVKLFRFNKPILLARLKASEFRHWDRLPIRDMLATVLATLFTSRPALHLQQVGLHMLVLVCMPPWFHLGLLCSHPSIKNGQNRNGYVFR